MIRFDGLSEFTRKVEGVDLAKAVRMATKDAADLLVGTARPKVPRPTGRAAGSIRIRFVQNKMTVLAGGVRAPYFHWLDFGGRVGRRKSVRRPYLKEGRYMYRSYFDLKQSGEFVKVMDRALLQVTREAGVAVD